MSTNSVVRSLTDTVSNVKRLKEELRAGAVIQIPDAGEGGYTLAPSSVVVLTDVDDYDEDGDMASLTEKYTGIKNTIFVSTKGRSRHVASIKIAIDPPDSHNGALTDTSMRIHDGAVIGAYMSPALVDQLKQWIDLNYDVLMAYWDEKIYTHGLLERLQPLKK
jgi:hypothetical protein